jgi:hypothetical protein
MNKALGKANLETQSELSRSVRKEILEEKTSINRRQISPVSGRGS